MILTNVTLQDYGVYRGRNEFDFSCTEQKPIVLVGGTNGAGKTTLFESIMLCLYGISAMTKRSTKKAYEKFLSHKIHRYMKSPTMADHASITVQFKFFHNGRETEYRVERSWQREEGSIIEHLNIKKRTSDKEEFGPLDTVEKSHWQSFIEDLIPKGIVRLFFFDGEKVVEIAKEGTEDITIRESFKSLLGIEIVEQLRSDLQVNLTRNLTGGTRSLQQDFGKYKAEKDELAHQTGRLRERLAQKQTELDSLQSQIENTEVRISKIGGSFASGRDDAKARLASLTLVYDDVRQKVADLCSGVLPFSMIPGHLDALSKQIMEDESIQQREIGHKILTSAIADISAKTKTKKFWNDAGLDSDNADKAASALIELLDAQIKDHIQDSSPVFGFSAMQASRINSIITQANTRSLEDLKEETEKLVTIGKEISGLESSITNAPSDDEIGSLVSEVGNLHSQAGMLQAEMDHIEEKISSNKSLKQHLDTKLRDIVSQIYKSEKSQQHVEMTQNIQKVLDEFIERLRAKKIHLLEQYLLDAIGILMHKKHLIERISVDTETFEVSLFGEDGTQIPKDLLSEGEKQMFAMSVLWALAKTSGRPLPFVIDTPLARLDEGHRTNIIEKFLPTASHQVLVFSTDTEVKNDDYQKLVPYLARSYAMEYVEKEGFTSRHNGYFWNKEGQKVVAI